MKKAIFKKSIFSSVFTVILSCFLTLTTVLMVSYGMKQAEVSSAAEGRRILEDGLRRAVITCYAIEGRYPESLSYIEEHYGIKVDTTKYAVFYSVEASNVFPNVTVLEAESEIEEGK